jgi:hypothetical protein
MKRILLMTAALIVAGTMASAAVTAQSLVSDLSAQGYSRIEVKTGLTQIKVEAIKGTTKVETIYDIASGRILKSETGSVGLFDDTAPGVELSDRNRDFLRGGSSDDSNDDNGHHSGDDDSGHHSGGDDHGGDDDSDDDHDDDSDDDHDSDNSGHGSDNSGHGSDD